MALNPSKWHWSQWIATITFLIFVKVICSCDLATPLTSNSPVSSIIYLIFVKAYPVIMRISIILSTLFIQVYVYGFYVEVSLQYLLTRVKIYAFVLGSFIGLLLIYSFTVHFSILWLNLLYILLASLLYVGSIILCYKKVEFRLIDYSEMEDLEKAIEVQRNAMGNGADDQWE